MEGAQLDHGSPERESTRFGALVATVGMLGGVVALATAAMVTVSVISRKLGYGGISGDFDFVQIGVAVAIFAFMPYTQWRRGNIVVDTFSTRWPPALVRAVDAAWDLLYALSMAVLAYAMAGGAGDAMRSGLSSMVAGLPLAPVFWFGSAMLALLAVTALRTAFVLLRRSA